MENKDNNDIITYGNKDIIRKLSYEIGLQHEKRSVAKSKYFKTISSLSVALIGLIIGLKPLVLPNQYSKVFFLISIILIGLCILFSLVVQYFEIDESNQEIDILERDILQYIQSLDEVYVKVEFATKKGIFSTFEKLTYVCLALSILSLILYAYSLEFIN